MKDAGQILQKLVFPLIWSLFCLAKTSFNFAFQKVSAPGTSFQANTGMKRGRPTSSPNVSCPPRTESMEDAGRR